MFVSRRHAEFRSEGQEGQEAVGHKKHSWLRVEMHELSTVVKRVGR